MTEEWRGILGWENRYAVSNYGRVCVISATTKSRAGRILSQSDRGNGYLCVTLSRPRALRDVHVLVCQAFHGPRPAGAEALHINNNRSDNRACNLRWGSHRENQLQMKNDGRSCPGSQNGNSKLSREEAIEIAKRINEGGESHRAVSRDYGISRTQAGNIARGDQWSSIASRKARVG
jgi:hypothetical protein